MSSPREPFKDPNLNAGLRKLLASGVPLLQAGTPLGPKLPGMPRPHIFDGIPGPAQAALKTLSQSSPFQLRDIVQLYRYVDQNLDNTINICARAQEQGLSLDNILAMAKEKTQAAGQPMDPEAIEVGVQLSEAGRVHIEFNKPVQFLVLTPEGAEDLIRSIQQALGEL